MVQGAKLINEYPILVLPSLAAAIGLNEAIVVQQIHYWLTSNEEKKKKDHYVDGRWWAYNTAEEWQKGFPWWSVTTVRRILAGLRECGIVLARDDLNHAPFDRTLWYSLDYDVIDDLEITPLATCEERVDQSDELEQPTLATTIPETTSETTHRTKKARTSPEHLAAIRVVMDYFTELTGLKPIGSETQVRWRAPAQEILEMVEWDTGDANRLVLAAHKQMREQHLTYNSIQSIVRVAAFIHAQETAPVRSGMKAW